APEQFLEGPIDARTDQFAFCVALYEALYGQRPFAGTSVIGLAAAVVRGVLQPPPRRSAEVPRWLRAVLLRGLAPHPASRHRSLAVLVALLAHDRGARLKRVALLALAAVAAAGVLALPLNHVLVGRRALRQVVERRHREAATFLDQARARRADLSALRTQ